MPPKKEPTSRRDERKPRPALCGTVYGAGCCVLIWCIIATGLACTAIILGSQANVCVTPYSYSKARVSSKSATFEQMKYKDFANKANAKDQQTTTIGWYSAPSMVQGTKVTWIYEDPMNCITECQMNCTAAYTEQAMLLKPGDKGGCSACLRNCTHPWGKNIETCHTGPSCTGQGAYFSKYHHNITNFCQPVAMCFQMCAGRGYPKIDERAIAMGGPATVKSGPVQWNKDDNKDKKVDDKDGQPHGKPSKNPPPVWTTAGYDSNKVDALGPKGKKLRCILECEYDGKMTVGFSLAAMCMVFLGPFFMICGAPRQLKSILWLIIGFCFLVVSMVFAIDAWLVNMQRTEGRGWELWAYENAPSEYEIISGNNDKGTKGRIKVTANWLMHVIYAFGLLANMFTLLAWYDREEIWNRRKPPPLKAPVRPEQPADVQKPVPKPMGYYGAEQTRQDEVCPDPSLPVFEDATSIECGAVVFTC